MRGLEKVYAAKGVICEFDIHPDARFHGEAGDLQELMGNLLENAFKWARSRVLLTATPTKTVGNRRAGLLLAVDDDGPGIADEDVLGVGDQQRVTGGGLHLPGLVGGPPQTLGDGVIRRPVQGGQAHEGAAERRSREVVVVALTRARRRLNMSVAFI